MNFLDTSAEFLQDATSRVSELVSGRKNIVDDAVDYLAKTALENGYLTSVEEVKPVVNIPEVEPEKIETPFEKVEQSTIEAPIAEPELTDELKNKRRQQAEAREALDKIFDQEAA